MEPVKCAGGTLFVHACSRHRPVPTYFMDEADPNSTDEDTWGQKRYHPGMNIDLASSQV